LTPPKILVLAEFEFREALEWSRERDPRVAERFSAEVRKTLQLIAQFPRIGGPVAGI